MGCPMGFGELNIPSSRAFWDDCDEDEPSKQTSEKLVLTYSTGAEPKAATPSDLFVIIEGANIADFADKTLLNSTSYKICDIPSKQSTLNCLTTSDRKVLLAIIEEDLTSSGEVTELLVPYARLADRVITITIKSKVDYKSENINQVREEIVFWRGVNSDISTVEALQPPNFFAGVSAGVASWRDNLKLPISSYVAYVDNVELDTLVSQPILKLLQEAGLQCAGTYNPKTKDCSNLYA